MIKYFFLYTVGAILFLQCNSTASSSSINEKSDSVSDTASIKNSSVANSKTSDFSEITCPKCKHTKTEKLPTEVCLVSYTCENCKEVLHPKDGDCCVFCSYGTHKCPSKQN